MTISLPPYTGDPDLDYFNSEVARQINTGEIGAGDAADVETGTDDEAYPTIGDLRLGYQERYLSTAYGTSSTGANFTTDYTAIVGLTVFQGLRNTNVTTESSNPADYTWRELNVITGWIPSYRIAGGRLVDWDFSTTTPTNYIVDNIAGAIDLDDFATGAAGADGEDGEDGENGEDGSDGNTVAIMNATSNTGTGQQNSFDVVVTNPNTSTTVSSNTVMVNPGNEGDDGDDGNTVSIQNATSNTGAGQQNSFDVVVTNPNTGQMVSSNTIMVNSGTQGSAGPGGGVETFYQTSPPATTAPEGSVWFDTDDNNRIYRLNSGIWTDATIDAAAVINANTTTINGGKITTGSIDVGAINSTSGTFNDALIGNLSAGKITTGTLNGTNVNITNLNADNISAGTLSANRIDVDGTTISSDGSGNLVVNHGAGLAVLGNTLGVQVDGSTIITDASGNLVALGGGAAEFPFTGSISGRQSSGGTSIAVNWWRFDTNLLGLSGSQEITGIELFGLSYSASVTIGASSGTAAGSFNFDLGYIGNNSTSGSSSLLPQQFDGGVNASIPGGTTGTQTFTGDFSTGGLVFPAPNSPIFGQTGRYLFLQSSASFSQIFTFSVSMTVSILAQSNAILTIHTSGGTAQTFNFNDYFL